MDRLIAFRHFSLRSFQQKAITIWQSKQPATFRKWIWKSNLTLFHSWLTEPCSRLNKINTVTIPTSYIPFHFPLHSIRRAAYISVFWLSLQLHSTITSLRMKYADRFHLSRCSLFFVKGKHRKVCSIANINWRFYRGWSEYITFNCIKVFIAILLLFTIHYISVYIIAWICRDL